MTKFLDFLIRIWHEDFRKRRTYYICFEKHYRKANEYQESWVIIDTIKDLSTSTGVKDLICEFEEKYGCMIWVINWKELKNR